MDNTTDGSAGKFIYNTPGGFLSALTGKLCPNETQETYLLMDNNMSFPESRPVSESVSILIRKTGFFSVFDAAEIDILSQWISGCAFPAGTFILHEGNNENCLCILIEGTVDIYKTAEPDKHLKIASIRPGETFGEMGVIDGHPFSASVIASQDSIVLMITRKDFDMLISQHGQIGIKLLKIIATTISSRLRNTTGRLADLMANKKYLRVA